ncbi:hypothetical protein U1Q18_023800 [Sarracenia purpurea var. burkii]
MSGGKHSDHDILLRSNSSASDGIKDLLKRLDCGFLGRRLSIKRLDRDHSSSVNHVSGDRGSGVGVGGDDILGNGAPPDGRCCTMAVFLVSLPVSVLPPSTGE